MLEVYLITFWLELNDKLSMKKLAPTINCKSTVEKLRNKYKDRPERLVAVKCDTLETIKQKKEMFD